MFCTKCGHQNPVEAWFCSSCGVAFQKIGSAVNRQPTPQKSRSSGMWFGVCVLLAVLLGLYSYRERFTHAAGMYSDLAYHLYDTNYGGNLKYTTRDGRSFFNCQYNTVAGELLACDSCNGTDRQRLVAEAESLQKHGNGWRLSDISDAEAVCPSDRELLIDLPDGFEVYCDHQRPVRVVLDPKECEGEAAPEGGVAVNESGSNKVAP